MKYIKFVLLIGMLSSTSLLAMKLKLENSDSPPSKKQETEITQDLVELPPGKEMPIEFDESCIVCFGMDKGWMFLKNYWEARQFQVKSISGSVFSLGHHGAVYPDGPTLDIRHASRKSIVDFFQENLIRFYQGKKLLKIQYALSYEVNGTPEFSPVIEKILSKTRQGTDGANAEIRMIYKLMNEIKDDDINLLAERTFEFINVKKNDDKVELETIKMPWEASAEPWINRMRKNQSSYESGFISAEKLPPWMVALIKYKDDLKYGRPGSYPDEGASAFAPDAVKTQINVLPLY